MLIDADGNEVTGTGPDHPGEVFVRSGGAFSAYYKNDASYAASSRATSTRSAISLTGTTRATCTSATARAT